MMDEEEVVVKRLRKQQMIIAMKGHPGSGKSTLARSIALTLRCPLIDKDDIRDSTQSLSSSSSSPKVLNEFSYEVMWRIAETQLDLGISVVIDSPLSRLSHLNRLRQLISPPPIHLHNHSHETNNNKIKLVIIECKPQDEVEWRRRLENRGAAAATVDEEEHGDPRRRRRAACCSSHKPAKWEDLQRLIQEYDGCWDYDVGDDVPKLVLDTTSISNNINDDVKGGVGNLVSSVLHFLSSIS